MKYPANIEQDGNGFVVSFPDIPEALTGADTYAEAIEMAQDSLITAFEFYFEDQRPIPMPSDIADLEGIDVPSSVWSKVLAFNLLLKGQSAPANFESTLEVQQEPRRIIQLITHLKNLHALCNDGTVWVRRGNAGTKGYWEKAKLAEIPQD